MLCPFSSTSKIMECKRIVLFVNEDLTLATRRESCAKASMGGIGRDRGAKLKQVVLRFQGFLTKRLGKTAMSCLHPIFVMGCLGC